MRSEETVKVTERTRIDYREDREKIAWLTIDLPGRESNWIDAAFIDDLETIFSKVEAELRLRGVIFVSGKIGSFLAGWDFAQLEGARDSEEIRGNSRRMQRIMDRIEKLNIPTVAAIHGICLGGGLELALACRVRVASNDETTVFGMPETQFGMLPGCGGTQRLRRRIGIKDSLDLILSGRSMGVSRARDMGLVDRIVPVENLRDEARLQVLSNRETVRSGRAFFNKEFPKDRLTRGKIFEAARETVARTSRGDNSALFRVIDVVERGLKEGTEAGLDMEARLFGDLSISRPAKNLMSVARLQREYAAYPGPWPKGTGERETRLVGVVGGDGTGAGIIYLLTDRLVRTRFRDASPEKVSSAFQRIAALHRRADPGEGRPGKGFERKMDHVTGTTGYDGFGKADLVIDTLPEEISLKKQLYGKLEERVDKSCVIGTTISSLSLFDLASDMVVPTRLVGLHVFHPIESMPFLEIIEGEWTDRFATRTVFNLARRLGKIPIVVKDTPGFLVNRIRMACIHEAFLLLEEGIGVEAIDQALIDFGFRLGPFQLIDRIGFDVASKAARAMKDSFGSRLPLSKAFEAVLAAARNGSIAAFYIAEGDGWLVNPQLRVEIGGSPEQGQGPGSLKIQNRLLNAMINEAVICLEEEVVARPEDIELGSILGLGFPKFRGGLLRFADQYGIGRIVEELGTRTADRGGKRQPADLLVKMAEEGKRFFG